MTSEAEYLIAMHRGNVMLLRADTASGSTTVPGNSAYGGEGNGAYSLPSPADVSLTIEPDADGRFRFSEPIDAEAVALTDDSIGEIGGRLIHVGLRESASLLPAAQYAACAKAAELLHWDATTRYCSCCGSPMRRHTPISKLCSGCAREIWPSPAPCAIVLIRRGDEALLVHARTFARPFYGLVAGFVETGESLEQAVVREVREETNLEITNLRYFGSQAWPFPLQLMIGFTADYAGGELRFADGELSAGGFFTRANHPDIPSPPSIARRLIDAWLADELR